MLHVQLTTDPDERVRYHALIALGKLGDMRAMEVLIEALTGTDADAACSGLCELGPKVVPRVLELLNSDSQGVLCCAISVLAKVSPSQARSFIAPFLEHPSELVRLVALDEIETAEDHSAIISSLSAV